MVIIAGAISKIANCGILEGAELNEKFFNAYHFHNAMHSSSNY